MLQPTERGVPMPTWLRHAEVLNALGLPLRSADRFVRLARGFQAEIRALCGARQADGKSILDLAALAGWIEAGFHESDP